MKYITSFISYFFLFIILLMCISINPYKKLIKTDVKSNVLKTNNIHYLKPIGSFSSISVKEETIDEKIELKEEEKSKENERIVENKVQVVDNSSQVDDKKTNQDSVFIENNTSLKEEVIEKRNDVVMGALSAYGPDCVGCSGYLASGYAVSNGIYYNDATYGSVRIVAGDRSYPFGTIVKVSNTSLDPFYAIVLDRGGIGFGKRYLFDLLFSSEREAASFGSFKNVQFEIIRTGY